MTSTHPLALVPREGFFCKDGRGWHTSASGRGHALDWPWPSTLLGALRTAWGRDEGVTDWREETKEVTLGRSLMLRRPFDQAWHAEHRVWPAPADALWLTDQKTVFRLEPERPELPTLGRDDDEAREALWVPRLENRAKPLPAPRWWGDGDFSAWLAGRDVPAASTRIALPRRVQAHVRIEPETLTADEGALFSHDIVETLEKDGTEWAAAVELRLPRGKPSSRATLGSDGRLARVEKLPSTTFEPPPALLEAFRHGSPGLRLAVVSPACFERGWLPDGLERRGLKYHGAKGPLEGLVLRAAMVSRPLHVSGWDLVAGGPKPTSRLVPPGAVYFFERLDKRPFDEADAKALWLAEVGDRTHEGFGHVVPGVWSPTRS